MNRLQRRLDRIERDIALKAIADAQAQAPALLNLTPSGEGFALIGGEWVPCADVYEVQREHRFAKILLGFDARDLFRPTEPAVQSRT